MNTSKAIQRLIRALVDDERTLQHERKFVEAIRAESLTKLAQERERFVTHLEQLGVSPKERPNGSWTELLREAGRNVWVTAVGPNNGDAIAMCRHSRARTETRYEEAMQMPWPDAIGSVLAEQHAVLHKEAQELNYLQF